MQVKVKIDFYVLETTGGQQSLFFACQLIEKIYAEHQQLYVHTNSREEAERLDALLWTYHDDSFLPHSLYQPDVISSAPIQIGYGEAPKEMTKVMLTLCSAIPAFYEQFTEVMEIVFPDPPVQQLARERYRQYRDQGHDVNTHKLKTLSL